MVSRSDFPFKSKKKLTIGSKKNFVLGSKFKRESFLPSDRRYIDENHARQQYEIDQLIGEGQNGEVWSIKGSKNLVVKLPPCQIDMDEHKKLSFFDQVDCANIQAELDAYNRFGISGNPIIIPTERAKVRGPRGRNVNGIVRPFVEPIVDYAKSHAPGRSKLTDKHIEFIRRNVIELSEQGVGLQDGIQLGFDRAGRPMIYDLGGIVHIGNRAYEQNRIAWKNFLYDIGVTSARDSDMKRALLKYGDIEKLAK